MPRHLVCPFCLGIFYDKYEIWLGHCRDRCPLGPGGGPGDTQEDYRKAKQR